jgi:excisionase family DNA binding protein
MKDAVVVSVPKLLYRLNEAAEIIAVSPRKLQYMIEDGTIPVIRRDRMVRIHHSVLIAYAAPETQAVQA